jgi:outer membrane beta-barrel protein
MEKIWQATIIILYISFSVFSAYAESFNEIAPDKPIPKNANLIEKKRFITKNKVELSAFLYDFTFLNKFVTHPYALHAGIGYHFFDWLALETMGGYVIVKEESDILKEIRDISSAQEPALPGLWQTDWFVKLDLQYAPIYGKLSILSEADLNYQLYILAGGGLEGIRILQNNYSIKDTALRYTGDAAIGLRLFFIEWLALRLEFRNSWGLNPTVSGTKNLDCSNGYMFESDGVQKCKKDVASSSWLQFGLSFFI